MIPLIKFTLKHPCCKVMVESAFWDFQSSDPPQVVDDPSAIRPYSGPHYKANVDWAGFLTQVNDSHWALAVLGDHFSAMYLGSSRSWTSGELFPGGLRLRAIHLETSVASSTYPDGIWKVVMEIFGWAMRTKCTPAAKGSPSYWTQNSAYVTEGPIDYH